MATEQQVFDMSLEAADDYYTSSKQFYIVALDTSKRAVLAGAADANTVGVLQNKPKQYQAATVRRVGVTKIVCGDTVAIRAKLVPDSAGKAVTGTAGQRYCAVALEAGVSGRVISAIMEFGYVPT